MKRELPPLPYPEFPLRPHRNGQWSTSCWNPRRQRSERFYFGSWKDDPTGDRALNDPVTGWLARRSGIKAGTDNVRIGAIKTNERTLGELMADFLVSKRSQVAAGDLSPRTLGDYLFEMEAFVSFMKACTPVGALGPAHFSAYMRHLINERRLGRHARKRVRAYVNAMLRHGSRNGWFAMPSGGADWVAPACDPESIRQAKLRAGQKDYSDRIVTGEEVDKLLKRSTTVFQAITLLGVNCGLGPADIGRLRWRHINMNTGELKFARAKTGVLRRAYLWRKTRRALIKVREIGRSREAIDRGGDDALVFHTRRNRAFYREREIYRQLEVEGRTVKKLVGIAVENPVTCTFQRMVRELGLEGMSYYRLRHSFRTLAKRAKDREAVDLVMGHKDSTTGKVYDHSEVSFARLKRVASVVYRQLWPKGRCAGAAMNGGVSPRIIGMTRRKDGGSATP